MKENRHEEYWSDYWQSDGREGEVFVDSKGGKPEYLRTFWQDFFSKIKGENVAVDVACGGGSIFEDIGPSDIDRFDLIATDISNEALKLAEKRISGITTYRCDGNDLPLDDRSVDAVVSQFGIEYAGISAFTEAARVLRKGGRLEFLCHYKNGYIDQRNEGFLAGAKIALSSGFIVAAKQLIDATYQGSTTKIRKAKLAFKIAEKPLALSFEHYLDGIHHHLYFGFRELYMNYKKYNREDVTKWIDDMERDIKKNIVKVSEIRSVSLDEKQVNKGLELLRKSGLEEVSKSPFSIPDTDNVIAWVISAKRL